MAKVDYSKKNSENYIEYIFRLYKYIRGKRHYGYSRALLWLSAGLLTPTLIDLVLAAFTFLESTPVVDKPATPPLITQSFISAILGAICILSSIAIFVVFELREQRIDEVSGSFREGALIITWPGNITFQWAANHLANIGHTSVRYVGFTTTELEARIRSTEELNFSSIEEALESLWTLTNPAIDRKYQVVRKSGYIELLMED